MRLPFVCSLLLAGLSVAAVCAPVSSGDDAAIRAEIRKYAEARDHSDAKATEALFTADADQLVSTGEWRRGRDALVKGTMASSKRETGQRVIAPESIRQVADGVALADCRYEVTGLDGQVRKMWSTFVLVRAADGWKIAAIRNMLPAPPSK